VLWLLIYNHACMSEIKARIHPNYKHTYIMQLLVLITLTAINFSSLISAWKRKEIFTINLFDFTLMATTELSHPNGNADRYTIRRNFCHFYFRKAFELICAWCTIVIEWLHNWLNLIFVIHFFSYFLCLIIILTDAMLLSYDLFVRSPVLFFSF